MHLVEDHELVLVIGEIEFRVGQFGTIRCRLEIQLDRTNGVCNLECQSRFSDLTRTEQSDRRVVRNQ